MDILQYFIFPTLTALVGSVSTLLFQTWIEHRVKRSKRKGKQNLSVYAGQWFAIHLTQNTKGETVFSEHVYTIKVDSSGNISGSFFDTVTSPWLEFSLTGGISEMGMVTVAKSSMHSNYYSVEVYPSPLSVNQFNIGILTSFDIKNHPFSTPIILGRTKPNRLQLERHLPEMSSMFRLSMPEAEAISRTREI